MRVPHDPAEQEDIVKNLTDATVRAFRPASQRQQVPDAAAPGLFLIVQPTGKKSWAWRGRIAGKPRKITLGRYPAHGLADAREWARSLTRQRDGGIDPLAERERQAQAAAAAEHLAAFTVDVAFDRYMEAEGSSRKSASEKRRMYDSSFKPAIGSLALHTVDRDAIETVIATKFRTHPLTSNRLVSLIKRFFRWCVTKGHNITRLDTDPTANISKMADEVKRDRVLTEYEMRLFLAAIRHEQASFSTPLKMLLLTGARRSEVFEACWDEFDLQTGDWLLPGARSKNGLPHIVPMPQSLVSLIEGISKRDDSPLLFASAGNPSNAVSGISKVIQRVRRHMEDQAKKDGRTVAHWRLHDIRRTVATGMAGMRGPDNMPLIAPHEIEAVLNHISGARAGVAGIYNRHAYYAEKKRALNMWSEKINDIEKQIGT